MPELNPPLPATIDVVRRVAQSEVMPRFLKVAFARKARRHPVVTEADIALARQRWRELRQGGGCAGAGRGNERRRAAAAGTQGHGGDVVRRSDDGTTNFVHGVPHFAVSVAFMRNGRPEMGVIYNPAMDEMYYALKGHGRVSQWRAPAAEEFCPPMQ